MGTNMIAAEHLEVIKLKPGEYLFKEGEKTYFFYLIQKGQAEIYTMDKTGKKITLAIAESGHAVGEFAAVTRRARSASARAMTDMELVKISESGYEQLLKELPPWALSMIQSLVERLNQADETIRIHSMENVKLKTALDNILHGSLKR